MSSISSTEYPAIAATPLAVSRNTRDSVGSGGSRTTTGPSTVVSCTTALDREVLSGARDLQQATHFGADSLQGDLFTPIARPPAGAQQAAQSRRVDEDDVGEVDHDPSGTLTIQDGRFEDRAAGDIDVAVHHDCAFGTIFDCERIVVSQFGHQAPSLVLERWDVTTFRRHTLRAGTTAVTCPNRSVRKYFAGQV